MKDGRAILFIGGAKERDCMADATWDVASREQLRDLLSRFFIAIDEGRWSDVADCLSEKTLLEDSPKAGRPTRTSRAKAVEALHAAVSGLTAVHHQLGNVLVRVEGGEGSAFCYCTTGHYFPNATGENTFTTVGTYDFHFVAGEDGWRIDALRYRRKFAQGNPLLADLARKTSKKR